jgi:outer membrane protein
VSGKLSSTAKSATRRSDAAIADAERTRQDTVFSVRAAYYEALYQDQRAAVFQSAVDVANEQLKNDTVAVEAGKAPAFYIDRDKAELAAEQQMLADVRRESATARIRLAALLGLDPSTPLELTDTLVAPDAGNTPVDILSNSPDLAAARFRVDAANASLRAAGRASRPDVAVTLMSDRIASSGNETMKGTTAALVVAFPLWDGGMRRSAKHESAAMRDSAAHELRNTELTLKADYQAARLEYDTAVANIATAESAVKSAEANYRVAKIRYEAGKGILVEMLDANAALIRARDNRIRAIRDALLARDMLLRLAGKL